jgi:hypothetical protein
MLNTTNKPLCPCCFKAFSTSILQDDVSDNNMNNSYDGSFNFGSICGTCEPTDVERALATKASITTSSSDDVDVPPIVWLLTPQEIEEATQSILNATQSNLDEIASTNLSDVTFDNTIAKLMCPPNYKTDEKGCL